MVFLYFLIISFYACAQSDSGRIIEPFDNGWKFQLGDDSQFKKNNFDDSGWRKLNVPHDWSIEGPYNPPPAGENNGGYFTHGIAWYRKNFKTPSDTLKKMVIEFDGVYMNSEVWINGQFLGSRPNGFVSFRYDITDYLKKNGDDNIIAVRVNDAEEPSLRWYAGAGIYRHVRLISTEFTHFKLDGGIYITTPMVSADSALINVNYNIDANFLTRQEYLIWYNNHSIIHHRSYCFTLTSSIIDSNGVVVTSLEDKIPLKNMQSGQKVNQQISLKNPLLWSDITPNLYKLKSTLTLDGKLIDEVTTQFGIRILKFDKDEGFFVNNKSVKLKGVCLHQDAGSFGNAVPIEIWAYRFSLLKQMGCNAVRTSHHPFAPEFYDLCDKMGLYVFDEAFDEWTRDWTYNFTENNRGKIPNGYHLYFDQWYKTDLKSMINRNRNHPSIILYSIGNEIPEQFNEDGWKIVKDLTSIVHNSDPTRPVTSGCNYSNEASKNGFMEQLDIFGYNYIDLINGDSTYTPERKRFPNKVLLGSETNHDLHYWLAVRDNRFIIGDFIWTGFDYLGEAKRAPLRGSTYGELDLSGGKKTGFYQRSAYWNSNPTLQLFTSPTPNINVDYKFPSIGMIWNYKLHQLVGIRASTNCEEVELFLNDKSLGRKKVSRNLYYSDWKTKFKQGTLKAVGYVSGKTVAKSILSTTNHPYKLKLVKVKNELHTDINIYEIFVTDANGLSINDAKVLVTVDVSGSGELIGLDSGELNYTGYFKTNARNTYNGRLLAVVKTTSLSKKAMISAKATGLLSAELLLE